MIVGRKKSTTMIIHTAMILGVLLLLLPIYIAFVASTHSYQELLKAPLPFLPGTQLWHNYKTVLGEGISAIGGTPVLLMMWRSFVMAMVIALGKLLLSIISAFALVYYRFRGRQFLFWLIFITIMLPVEVRIVPTFQVVAHLNMLNSYAGLTLPLIASATATFMFRQFFLTIPDELTEAALMDGVRPMRFLWEILLPLSKTNITALFIIMFIYGWNQYLWPLVVTTQGDMTTVIMGIQQLAQVADQVPQWNYIMATVMLAMLPPVLIVVVMQRWFVKGLVDVEK